MGIFPNLNYIRHRDEELHFPSWGRESRAEFGHLESMCPHLSRDNRIKLSYGTSLARTVLLPSAMV